jgi:hypothetical protein
MLSLTSAVFLSDFLTEFVGGVAHLRAPCPAHPIVLYFVIFVTLVSSTSNEAPHCAI